MIETRKERRAFREGVEDYAWSLRKAWSDRLRLRVGAISRRSTLSWDDRWELAVLAVEDEPSFWPRGAGPSFTLPETWH
jgi:hypothetical protein